MSEVFELGFGRTKHEIALDQLPVQGDLPAWLDGTLVRNGPGTFQVGEERYRHWFDGLAMLHKFSFHEGRVSYANKFLDCSAYRQAEETGRISYSEFATDPSRSIFGRVTSLFFPKISDSAKVSVAKIAGRFMALTEAPIQVVFDPQTLASVGVFNYEDRLFGQTTTVHPQFDLERGEVYNLVTRYNAISHYRIYRVRHSGRPELVGSLPVRQPAYLHSFGMTQNYFILAEFPFVVNPINLLLWLKPYIQNFHWRPEKGTPFWIISRKTGQVVGRFESDPFFAFHHVNAFEKSDELFIDIVAYPDAGILDAFYLDQLKNPASELPFGILRRYRIPLKGKSATYQVLSDQCMELPRFDDQGYNTNENYHYVYASSIRPEQRAGFYNQIIKVDVQTGQSWDWCEENCYPGEPVFVGSPDRTSEDEGLILSVVLDAGRAISFLLALDAHSFTERARAELPHPVLFGYHGAYFEGV